jgi:hypothetical protein
MLKNQHISRLRRVTLASVISALCLLIASGGIAGAGMILCRTDVERTSATPASKEACCCCAKSANNQCSTGLKGGCGESRKTSDNLALLSAEAIGATGLSPSPVQTHSYSYSKEGSPQSIFFLETVYLINVKFLC